MSATSRPSPELTNPTTGYREAMGDPLKVGLVGAGPWASLAHAPMLARSPAIELAGIWARRPELAAELATANATRSFEQLDALFDACEAVAFAVPPDVQAELASRAARAGKAVLLEKPLATSLTLARSLTDAVLTSGVGSLMFLTWRYSSVVREFLDSAAGTGSAAGRSSSPAACCAARSSRRRGGSSTAHCSTSDRTSWT
jgi:hypothetical protein